MKEFLKNKHLLIARPILNEPFYEFPLCWTNTPIMEVGYKELDDKFKVLMDEILEDHVNYNGNDFTYYTWAGLEHLDEHLL